MHSRILREVISVFILFICFSWGYTQDSIPRLNQIDSTVIDSTRIDTVVIRRTLLKIKYIPRGVNLTNPIISFNKTKPLLNVSSKFRVPSFWTKINKLGINLSEVAFVNWNAGGNNSVSGLGNARFERNYKFRYIKWDNYLQLKYGLNAQEGRKLRKTDDAIRFSSTFGYRRDTISNWYYSVKAKFNTQFANGYKYPDRTTPISRFMAPGYFFLGAGTSYISENQKFNLYVSPLTQKATFVMDQDLANKGAFGVKKAILDSNGNVLTEGENQFIELGFLITNKWETAIMENVGLRSNLSLYTDYLSSFGNIDIDWELNINLKVNKYITTSLGTHFIYDDDILFDRQVDANGIVIDPGEPRLQFKQLLGVGVTYEF
ncbi:DUF3078 domain-containing protein [Maribacter sp. HTCC2170]|uniref:DUF3078 domain-containing protein n=1 Tax=Maribacter sp. (strain HTCC2170 / KCCM 42371) TaxID=313603 RepID=UPI00006BD381|nr:DUF3078 domain-containing protein [Maribacter sp. HTCC2170]EAR02580.1 hypothetical protein FB2170_04815 [Maribacter sp. HTCC2170]